MKEAVKSVSVETYYRIAKIFLGTHILTCRREEAGTTRDIQGAEHYSLPSLQQLQSPFVAILSQQELCFPGVASEARKRKNQTSRSKVKGFRVATNSSH